MRNTNVTFCIETTSYTFYKIQTTARFFKTKLTQAQSIPGDAHHTHKDKNCDVTWIGFLNLRFYRESFCVYIRCFVNSCPIAAQIWASDKTVSPFNDHAGGDPLRISPLSDTSLKDSLGYISAAESVGVSSTTST